MGNKVNQIGIYQSIRQEKLMSKQMIVPIWKIWDQDRIIEPEKKVDKRRITESQQKEYKDIRIITTLKVTNCLKSTSRVPDYKAKTYEQASFDNFGTFVMKKNNGLFGDSFND